MKYSQCKIGTPVGIVGLTNQLGHISGFTRKNGETLVSVIWADGLTAHHEIKHLELLDY